MRSRFSKGDDVGGDLALSLLRDAQLSVCRAQNFAGLRGHAIGLRGFHFAFLDGIQGFPEGRFQVLCGEIVHIPVSFAVAC